MKNFQLLLVEIYNILKRKNVLSEILFATHLRRCRFPNQSSWNRCWHSTCRSTSFRRFSWKTLRFRFACRSRLALATVPGVSDGWPSRPVGFWYDANSLPYRRVRALPAYRYKKIARFGILGILVFVFYKVVDDIFVRFRHILANNPKVVFLVWYSDWRISESAVRCICTDDTRQFVKLYKFTK